MKKTISLFLISWILLIAMSCEVDKQYDSSGLSGQATAEFPISYDMSSISRTLETQYNVTINSVTATVENSLNTYGPVELSFNSATDVAAGTISDIIAGEYTVILRAFALDSSDNPVLVAEGSAIGILIEDGMTTTVDIAMLVVVDLGSLVINGTITDKTLIFEEDFESYTVDTRPSDYIIAYNGTGSADQVVKAESDNQYLQTKGASGWGLSMRKDFTEDLPSETEILLRIQTQTMSNPTSYNTYGFCDVGGFYFKNAAEVAGAFKMGVKSDGLMYIWSLDGTGTIQSVSVERNTWVDAKVVIDFNAQTFDLYINDVLLSEAINMGVADLGSTWNPYGENACIMYHSGNTTTTTTCFDDVQIYQVL